MSKKEEICALMNDAETLKENIWVFLEKHKIDFKGVRQTMNELLDLIQELDL